MVIVLRVLVDPLDFLPAGKTRRGYTGADPSGSLRNLMSLGHWGSQRGYLSSIDP